MPAAVLAAVVAAVVGGCNGGARSTGADAGADVRADANVEIASWTGSVAWPMPNPPGSYDLLPSPGVVIDRVTGLGWQRAVGTDMVLWSDAGAACDALSLAGFDDWRLPSLIELVSIIDSSRAGPAIDPGAFPDTPGDSFWTSTPVAGASGDAWYVNFSTGFNYEGHQAFLPLYVRCVRTQI